MKWNYETHDIVELDKFDEKTVIRDVLNSHL